jgi:hypothetical protein
MMCVGVSPGQTTVVMATVFIKLVGVEIFQQERASG